MQKNNQKIPEGWSVKKLGDCCSFMGGGTPSRATLDFFNGSIPWVKTTDLNNSLLYKTEENISELGLNNSSCKIISKGAVCVAMYGGFNQIGRTCLLGMNAAVNQAITAIIPSHILSNKYLLTYLNFNVHQWKKFASSSRKDPNITKQDITFFQILLPPLPEQEKIAEILSCWDDGIEKLSALIEKKKIQKKALMQQLLTGKHRLKGFSSPWHEVKLKDVLYEHKETSKGDETICSVSVHKGIISQIEHLGRSFAASNTSNYNLVHYGDIVYTKSPTGEFPYGIFKQSQQRKSVIVSPLYGVFTPKTYYLGYILDVFFSYAINLNNYLKPIIQKGAKNTINITNETFLSKAIFLPEETTEIQKLAEIFIKADEEIELLNKKLEAFKLEKKALMQQLLTGKIRVKVN